MKIDRDPYPVYRQSKIVEHWTESLDRIERRKKGLTAQVPTPVFWGPWPVNSTDQNVRHIPSSLNSDFTARDEPVHKTSNAQALETRLMFLRNDRHKAKKLLQQYLGTQGGTTEAEVMMGNEHQKASQRIIDNIGPNTIRRDDEGNVILEDQWVWDINNNKYRQVVFRV